MNTLPYIRAPGTDITSSNGKFQMTGCRDFEMKFYECMEAHGIPLGYKKCTDLYDDFFECATKTKQNNRISAMRVERDRQFKAGTLKEHYAPPPRIDSY